MAERIENIDKIFSALSYLTVGWVGFLYCIFLILNKKRISHFLRFNVFQSIFLALLFFVLCAVFGLIFKLLSMIPFIHIIVSWIQLILFRPIIFQYSLTQIITISIMLYTTIYSLMGKYPRIYWVSNIIDYNTKR